MVKNSNNLNWRVEQLEKCVLTIDNKFDELLTNHLPHIDIKLRELETRITIMTGINCTAIILGVLIAKYL